MKQNKCFNECWNAPTLPWPHTKRDEWYNEYCTRECRKQYMECEKENEKKAKELKFSRVDDAIGWIRAHKAEVALGTVVIIAGIAFVRVHASGLLGDEAVAEQASTQG